MDSSNIVLATGGYDHSIKFWYPHDGVCYRTAHHPESVSLRLLIYLMPTMTCFTFHLQQVNRLEVTPDKRFVASAGIVKVYDDRVCNSTVSCRTEC